MKQMTTKWQRPDKIWICKDKWGWTRAIAWFEAGRWFCISGVGYEDANVKQFGKTWFKEIKTQVHEHLTELNPNGFWRWE